MAFLLNLLIFATLLLSADPKHSMYEIEVDYELEEAAIVGQGLRDFNTPFLGNKNSIRFAVYLKDEKDRVVGGILAWIRPGIKLVCIEALWISQAWRHQGYGKQLMLTAEAEGKKHGCIYAQVDTLSFQAEKFYQKLGYYRIGEVKKLYGDHDAIFMRKNLDGKN